jgi:hypothetical protein
MGVGALKDFLLVHHATKATGEFHQVAWTWRRHF